MLIVTVVWLGFNALILIVASVAHLLGPWLDRLLDRAFGVDPLERAWTLPAVIPDHEQTRR